MRAILTYHSIDDSDSPISVRREVFRAHCRALADAGVRVVPLDRLATLPGTDDAVALTFDDGFQSFADDALPVIAEHGFPVTVFVVSGHVGQHNDWGGRRTDGIPHLPLMAWETLGRLAEAGVSIGSHTVHHPRLSQLDQARVADELDADAERLARELGARPATFAYPYGDHDPGVVAAVRARYAWACSTELRPLHATEDPALLPRLDAFYLRRPDALSDWGGPAFRARLWVRGLGRRARAAVLGGTSTLRSVA